MVFFPYQSTEQGNIMLSAAFIEFVSHLDPTERVIVEAKRRESIQEFFRNRSTSKA